MVGLSSWLDGGLVVRLGMAQLSAGLLVGWSGLTDGASLLVGYLVGGLWCVGSPFGWLVSVCVCVCALWFSGLAGAVGL